MGGMCWIVTRLVCTWVVVLMAAWACECSMDNLRELGKGDMYVWRMYLNATAGNDRFRSGYLLKVSGPKKMRLREIGSGVPIPLLRPVDTGGGGRLQGAMGIGG